MKQDLAKLSLLVAFSTLFFLAIVLAFNATENQTAENTNQTIILNQTTTNQTPINQTPTNQSDFQPEENTTEDPDETPEETPEEALGEKNDEIIEEYYFPVMHVDEETREEWAEEYERAPKIEAPKTRTLSKALSSVNLLSQLDYDPETRDQGSCGNCWQWSGNALLEIELERQLGIFDRLSVQYPNSCQSGTCCDGGWLEDLTDFYDGTGKAIPDSNTGANWQDGGASCSTTCASITKEPSYPIADISTVAISTHTVADSAAKANIKYVLDSGKAVWFGFFLADSSDWLEFYSFWALNDTTDLFNYNFSCGHIWNPSQGAGHAVTIVGYNDTASEPYWLVLNSWGNRTNRPDGTFRIPMNLNYSCADNIDYTLNFQTISVDFENCSSPNPGGALSCYRDDIHYYDDATYSVSLNYTDCNITARKITVQSGANVIFNNVTLTVDGMVIQNGATVTFRNGGNTVWYNGDLNISGSLEFNHETVRMNVTAAGEYGIYVKGTGTLRVANGSVISNGTQSAGYQFENNGTLYIIDSNVSFVSTSSGILVTSAANSTNLDSVVFSGMNNFALSAQDDIDLYGDITVNSNALNLSKDTHSVTLNCHGSWIIGPNANVTYGVRASNTESLTIQNCQLKNFTSSIYFTNVNSSTLTNITTRYGGVGLNLSASSLNQFTNISTGYHIRHDGSGGLILFSSSDSNTIQNFSSTGSLLGLGIRGSSYNTVSDVSIVSGLLGLIIGDASQNNTISNTTINSNAYGLYFANVTDFNYINGVLSNSNTYGMYLANVSNLLLINLSSQANLAGIVALNISNVTVFNSTTTANTAQSIFLFGGSDHDASLTIANTTFDNITVSENSSLEVKWYVTVNVTDPSKDNSSLVGATVTLKNSSDALTHTGTTDSRGLAKFLVTEYRNVSGNTFRWTNYTLNVTSTISTTQSFNLSDNRYFNVSLDPTVPVVSWNDFYGLNLSIPRRYVTLSWTSTETVTNCSLYFNGTRYQNTTTGTSFSKHLSALGDGNYTINVTCEESSGNKGSSSTSWVDIDTTTADLNITNSDILLSSNSPYQGTLVTVNVTVHNMGSTASGEFTLAFLLDGSLYASKDFYVAGNTSNSTLFNWTAGYGTRNITMVADYYHNVTESNKNNNNATRIVVVRARSGGGSGGGGGGGSGGGASAGSSIPVAAQEQLTPPGTQDAPEGTGPVIRRPSEIEEGMDSVFVIINPDGSPYNGKVIITNPEGLTETFEAINGEIILAFDMPGTWMIAAGNTTLPFEVVSSTPAESEAPVKIVVPSSRQEEEDYTLIIIAAAAILLIGVAILRSRR